MIDVKLVNGWRDLGRPPNVHGLPPYPAGHKVYQKDLADGHLTVLVGLETPAEAGHSCWHLSISHRSNTVLSPLTRKPAPGRIPSWEEIKEARYLFCPDGVTMAMLLPPKAEWVDVHPTTMHLWEVPADRRTV